MWQQRQEHELARKTVRARRLGKQIYKLRVPTKMTQDRLCEAINVGQSTGSTISQGQLSKIEKGTARLDADQLARIVVALNGDDKAAARLESLRALADQPGWWHEYSPYIHETLELVVELGEDSVTMRSYDGIVVHGLLQTEDYARTIIESARAWVRPTDVEMLVELRMRCQHRLTEPDFHGLNAVITEAALRHQVGGPAVMRAQLEKLCAVAEEGTAALRVLPFDAGPWPGVGGFVIYGFPEDEDAEVVLVDGDLGAGIYEDREPINAMTYTFNAALAQALPGPESLALCRSIIKEL